MRLKPVSSASSAGQTWHAYTRDLQVNWEQEAEGAPFPDSPDPGNEGKAAGKVGGKKGESRKRALSEASSESTIAPAAKKKKSAAIVIDSDNEAGAETPSASASASKKKDKKAGDSASKDKDGKEKPPGPLKGRKMQKGAPYDPNKNCGVVRDGNPPCRRSLTCKTHSMGEKRSVPGRSAPYDVLLHEWQKLTNPNFGDRKVVTPRVGPGIPPITAKRSKKKGGGDGSGGGTLAPKALSGSHVNGSGGYSFDGTGAGSTLYGEVDEDFEEDEKGGRTGIGGAMSDASDSDDETDLVLRGLAASSGGRPLAGGDHALGGLWMSRWNRFGKYGVREGYREAFRLGGGAGTHVGTGTVAYGVGR